MEEKDLVVARAEDDLGAVADAPVCGAARGIGVESEKIRVEKCVAGLGRDFAGVHAEVISHHGI